MLFHSAKHSGIFVSPVNTEFLLKTIFSHHFTSLWWMKFTLAECVMDITIFQSQLQKNCSRFRHVSTLLHNQTARRLNVFTTSDSLLTFGITKIFLGNGHEISSKPHVILIYSNISRLLKYDFNILTERIFTNLMKLIKALYTNYPCS